MNPEQLPPDWEERLKKLREEQKPKPFKPVELELPMEEPEGREERDDRDRHEPMA